MSDKEPICALAGRPCPKNGAPSRGDFCPWWRDLPFIDKDTGKQFVAEDCSAHHIYTQLDKGLEKLVGEVMHASRTVQDDRNEQKRALETVESASKEGGAEPILVGLAALGLRSYLGARILPQHGDDISDANPSGGGSDRFPGDFDDGA